MQFFNATTWISIHLSKKTQETTFFDTCDAATKKHMDTCQKLFALKWWSTVFFALRYDTDIVKVLFRLLLICNMTKFYRRLVGLACWPTINATFLGLRVLLRGNMFNKSLHSSFAILNVVFTCNCGVKSCRSEYTINRFIDWFGFLKRF